MCGACNWPVYPDWVCCECAKANGGKIAQNHISAWYDGECGWCNQKKPVTQPKDFQYPKYEVKGS